MLSIILTILRKNLFNKEIVLQILVDFSGHYFYIKITKFKESDLILSFHYK